MRTVSVIPFVGLVLFTIVLALAAPDSERQGAGADDGPEIIFTPSAAKIESYDFFEVALSVNKPMAKNPFTDTRVSGEFKREDDAAVRVEGFCDSADGGTQRIRFMPTKTGKYTYTVTFRQGEIA